jgi:hypothetical protein
MPEHSQYILQLHKVLEIYFYIYKSISCVYFSTGTHNWSFGRKQDGAVENISNGFYLLLIYILDNSWEISNHIVEMRLGHETCVWIIPIYNLMCYVPQDKSK